MGRIRTIKPEIATHEGLFDLECETGLPIRFAWCMLFTVCDREGRFAWRPRTLKAAILPHDEIEFSRVLDAWLTRGFIVKYRVKTEWFGWIPTFTRHQLINNRESPSGLPTIEDAEETEDHRHEQVADVCQTCDSRDDDACPTREVHAQAERKEGKERNSNARVNDASCEIVEKIYQAYPRHVGKPSAFKAIEKALKLVEGETLLERVQAYANSPAGQAGKYTPHPATWFNDRRWEDDPSEWQRAETNGHALNGHQPEPKGRAATSEELRLLNQGKLIPQNA